MEEGSKNPVFSIEINELSGLLTNLVFNPNRDIEEDRERLTKYNKKKLEMLVSKIMLGFYTLTNIEKIERVIFFYKYPKFSQFC